ncbi:MAG: hypothetical protein D3M94_04850 [Rhodocyclales bacterium GT-UBC]|nr:MAG: hypothetical protein D3M94_04850 [Rhodocyclales bacterium GT-UBC]
MIRPLLMLCAALLAAPVSASDLTALDRSTARQLMADASQGQPTIVALWSVECTHCKKNLQLFSTLARQHKNLRLISIAAEPEGSEHARILDRHAMPAARYAYGSDAPEAVAYAIDPNWSGELPRSYLFDGKGGKQKHSGVLSRQQVEQETGLAPRR